MTCSPNIYVIGLYSHWFKIWLICTTITPMLTSMLENLKNCIQLTWQLGDASHVSDNISTSIAFETEVLPFLGLLVGETADTTAAGGF